jgi:hypothetical protein
MLGGGGSEARDGGGDARERRRPKRSVGRGGRGEEGECEWIGTGGFR